MRWRVIFEGTLNAWAELADKGCHKVWIGRLVRGSWRCKLPANKIHTYSSTSFGITSFLRFHRYPVIPPYSWCGQKAPGKLMLPLPDTSNTALTNTYCLLNRFIVYFYFYFSIVKRDDIFLRWKEASLLNPLQRCIWKKINKNRTRAMILAIFQLIRKEFYE